MLRNMSLLTFVLLTCSTWSQPVSLEPLEPITWTLQEAIEDVDTPLAMSLRASGKRLNANFRVIAPTPASFYDDPLTCAIAGLTAVIDTEEAWWGGLVATAEQRDSNGTPLSEYTADSEQNLYTMMTYHTQDVQVPQAIDADIVTYLRIGGMHAFEVRWSEVIGQTPLPQVKSLIAVQQFAAGKYRIAPEWFSPSAKLYPMFEDTEFQSATMEAYRTSVQALSREVDVHNLFGEQGNAFPLTLLFRGVADPQSNPLMSIATRKGEIASAIEARHGATLSGQAPVTYDDVADLFTPDSLTRYQQQTASGQIQIPFVKDTSFVIDSGSVLLAFGRDPGTGTLSKFFSTFVAEENELRLANYAVTTLFAKFIADDQVWTPLSQAMEATIGAP